MLRNKIGPVFNARNGSFFFFVFLVVFEKSSSFCRENEIFKNKKTKKTKKLDQFLTLEKAKIGPVFNSTADIYIYICIYGHNLNQWAQKRSKSQNFPSFTAENGPEEPPHLVWGYSTFQCLSSFSSLPSLALVFRLPLCFLPSKSLRVVHRMRL